MKLKLSSSSVPQCPNCERDLFTEGTVYLRGMRPYYHSWSKGQLSVWPREENLEQTKVTVLYCPTCEFRTEQLDGIEYEEFDVWGEDSKYSRTDWHHEVTEGNTNAGYWEWAHNQRRANE